MRRRGSGSEIELHRTARLRDGRARGGQAEVFEDLLDRGALGQEGEHGHATAAAFAAQDVEAEDTLEQLRPRNPGRRLHSGGGPREGGRNPPRGAGGLRGGPFGRPPDLLAPPPLWRAKALENKVSKC